MAILSYSFQRALRLTSRATKSWHAPSLYNVRAMKRNPFIQMMSVFVALVICSCPFLSDAHSETSNKLDSTSLNKGSSDSCMLIVSAIAVTTFAYVAISSDERVLPLRSLSHFSQT